MPFAIVVLVVTVALARGGYAAWGVLVLELGAVALVLWVVVEVLWGTTSRERAHYRKQPRGATDVEIFEPGGSKETVRSKPSSRYRVLFGYPFKKTHVGVPVALLLMWVASSLVPLPGGWLAGLSPQAVALRGPVTAPLSLAPFLTLRSLWIGFALLALVFVSAHAVSRPQRLEQLSLLLFVAGIGLGLFGMAQWLFGLQELFGRDPTTSSLRASGSFGNRNHYAAFMEMLLLCGLGWMGARHAGMAASPGRRKRGFARRIEETGGKLFFLALGVVVISLGLVFSLSRSGITFAFVGASVFVLLRPSSPESAGKPEAPRERRRKQHGVLALGLVVVGLAAWIGLDPVVHRFKLLPDEWEAERGRALVWEDSLRAVPDFAVTGSGLSSYRYVFPIYRSFGGTIAYSWAHNDYLQILIELGVPGLLLLFWLMGAVWLQASRVRKALEGDEPSLYMHSGYVAACIALALHSFTDFSLHLAANSALLAVVVGVVVGAERGENRSPER